ncbi:hypothetical protein T439DRAFT_324328 [Meredithblackwellia eburnea MCA 4105]
MSAYHLLRPPTSERDGHGFRTNASPIRRRLLSRWRDSRRLNIFFILLVCFLLGWFNWEYPTTLDSTYHEGSRLGEDVYIPLSNLGKDADDIYKIGTTNRIQYQAELEEFIRSYFPPHDSNDTDPHSLLNDMRQFFPEPTLAFTERQLPPVPFRLFQAGPTHARRKEKNWQTRTWPEMHPDLNITFHDNDMKDSWVKDRFSMAGTKSSIVEVWRKFDKEIPVLKSDVWRYLILAVEGGIYADLDVTLFKSIHEWGHDIIWNGRDPEGFYPPSLIVGIEIDARTNLDWRHNRERGNPRPLQFLQWTMGAARGHPVLIDIIRRCSEIALAPGYPYGNDHESVMERTGPGPWSDAVVRYLTVMWGKNWADMKHLPVDGWRYQGEKGGAWGDTKILTAAAFAPYHPEWIGGRGIGHPAVLSNHGFDGAWE